MLEENFKKNILRYLINSNNTKILLAISGGLDSTVLLYLLNKFKDNYDYEIICLHVNYKHNENSDLAQNFCKALTNKYKIQFIPVVSCPISKNFEHNARAFRYEKLINFSKKMNIDVIITAHHLDDQLETIFMKNTNNSDWVSKIGIRSEYGKIKRPLLDIPKTSIIAYANKYKINFIQDLSNYNTKYVRNNIRINRLPKEKINNPNIEKELIDMKNESIKKLSLFNENISNYNSQYLIENNIYYIKIDNNTTLLNTVLFKLYYHYLIKRFFSYEFTTTNKHWNEIKKTIAHSGSGAIININTNYLIIKDRAHNYIVATNYFNKIKNLKRNSIIEFSQFPFNWESHTFHDTVDNKKDFNKFSIPEHLYKEERLFLRCWNTGDRCYSNFYKKEIKLKKIFINNKISIIDKYTMPIIVDKQNNILCVPDLYTEINNKYSYKTIYWNKYK
jgi:tRNA(Ile)-lysidine synthase